MKLKKTLTLIISFLLPAGTLFAQDLHASQFHLFPVQYNPASTGLFRGNFRAALQYRDQWASVPVQYRTYSAAAEYRFWEKAGSSLTGGVQIQRDRAGDGQLAWTQAGLSLGVGRRLSAAHALFAGFGLNGLQRSVEMGDLRFGNQWNGRIYDPALSARENLAASTPLAASLTAGIAWAWSLGAGRSSVQAGVSAAHINRPRLQFESTAADYRLPVRLNAHAAGMVNLSDRLYAVGSMLFQQMARSREYLVGGGLRLILDKETTGHKAIQFTVSTRVNDAWIPAVQLEYEAWTVGFSYDLNTSGFRTATNGRGGPELALVYRPIPVEAVQSSRICPIF